MASVAPGEAAELPREAKRNPGAFFFRAWVLPVIFFHVAATLLYFIRGHWGSDSARWYGLGQEGQQHRAPPATALLP